MTLVLVQSNPPGSDWENIVEPAWILADSMNGSSGTVTYTSPAGSEGHLLAASLLDDDGSVPPVITVTAIRIQFDWTVTCSGATQWYDSINTQAVLAGGGAGSFDGTVGPIPYWGADDRAAVFNNIVLWQFLTNGVSLTQAITVSNFTITVTYTAAATPEVTRINPSAGSVNGSQTVTITGTGFTGAPSATIGGVALTLFVVVDDETITGVTGQHASGVVDVEVTGVGTLTNGYTYVIPPSFRLPPLPTRTPIMQGGRSRRG